MLLLTGPGDMFWFPAIGEGRFIGGDIGLWIPLGLADDALGGMLRLTGPGDMFRFPAVGEGRFIGGDTGLWIPLGLADDALGGMLRLTGPGPPAALVVAGEPLKRALDCPWGDRKIEGGDWGGARVVGWNEEPVYGWTLLEGE